jgi:hypothetical protein
MAPTTAAEFQRVLPVTSSDPANVEALFKEAKRRERRRRFVAVFGLIVFLVIVASLILALTRGSPGSNTSAPPLRRVQSTAPTPAFYVAHAPTSTAEPGAIEVVKAATGHVVRQLGLAYDPYPENGFQLAPNGSTLYYVQLDQAAQSINIVAVSVHGGATTVIGRGIDPQISPNGVSMSFEPYGRPHALEVMNLRTKSSFILHVPTNAQSQRIFGVSWLPDSRQLMVSIGWPNRNDEYSCPSPPSPGVTGNITCPTFPPPPPPVSYVVDTKSHTQWSRVPSPRGLKGGWKYLTLEGAGPRLGTVLVLRSSATSNASAIETEQVATGRILSSDALPGDNTFLARDQSGTHFLIASVSLNLDNSSDH